MRLTLTLITLLAFQVFSQNAIINGGFENWSDDTLYVSPQQWSTLDETQFYGQPTTYPANDAVHGNLSSELTAVQYGPDTISGYAFLGDPATYDGISYTPTFEAVTFSYKANLMPGDTLFFIFIRKNGGALIDYQIIPAAYGNATTWTPNLLYLGNMIQDEVFMGFMLQNPWSSANANPNSWVRIDNVQTINGGVPQASLPNFSFENWDAATYEEADNWYSLNWFLGNFGLENANKTTDAYAGNFAIEMNTFAATNDTIMSIISMAPIDLFSATPFSNAPFNATPNLISGAYKFNAVNGDQAGMSLTFFNNGNAVGAETVLFDNQANWTTFSQPITLTGTPDSITFIAISGNNPGSVLFLDELSMTTSAASIFDLAFDAVSVYPNPAKNELFVGLPDGYVYDVIIRSVSGQVTHDFSSVSHLNRIDISNLNPGIYTVTVSDQHSSKITKVVVE